MERNLSFLKELSNEELEPIVALMKDRWTDELTEEAKNTPKEHLNEILGELLKYAGNTIANIFRGDKGVSYREALEDVCKKQKVKFTKYISTENLGYKLIEQIFTTTIDNMSKEEKQEFINSLKESMGEEDFNDLAKEAAKKGGLYALSGNALAMILFKSAGFGAYTFAATAVTYVFHLLGRTAPYWLVFGGTATIVKTVSGILFGPIGWTLFGIWGAINIASPATRVTVPAIIYIESMRIMKNQKKYIE